MGPAVMQQELDGVRLLSNTCCEFMHRVSCKLVNLLESIQIVTHYVYMHACVSPFIIWVSCLAFNCIASVTCISSTPSSSNTASTLSVLKVASLQPGAILNDAYKEYKVR